MYGSTESSFNKARKFADLASWRRGRDSNPRNPLEVQHISSVLHSTTLAPLLISAEPIRYHGSRYFSFVLLNRGRILCCGAQSCREMVDDAATETQEIEEALASCYLTRLDEIDLVAVDFNVVIGEFVDKELHHVRFKYFSDLYLNTFLCVQIEMRSEVPFQLNSLDPEKWNVNIGRARTKTVAPGSCDRFRIVRRISCGRGRPKRPLPKCSKRVRLANTRTRAIALFRASFPAELYDGNKDTQKAG